MQIDFNVTVNGGWPNNAITYLFGSMYNQEAGPWYVAVSVSNNVTKLVLQFKTADNQKHQIVFPPFTGNTIVGPLKIDFNLWRVTWGITTILFPPGEWFQCDTQLFQVGAVGDSVNAQNTADLTFNQLSLGPIGGSPWISLWHDIEPDQPWVHCYGSESHFYGFLILNTAVANIIGTHLSDMWLSTTDSKYGQTVGIGFTYDMLIERCHISNGAQNIGMINSGTDYPLRFRDCVLDFAGYAAIYGCSSIMNIDGLTLGYMGQHAGVFKGCNVMMNSSFLTDSTADPVFKMLDNRGNGGLYRFCGGCIDNEGHSPKCYWYYERHANTPQSSLRIEDYALGKIATGGCHVVLKDSVMAQSTKQPSYCAAYISDVGGPSPGNVAIPPGERFFTYQADPCWLPPIGKVVVA
jgi:hypothetical protein